MRLAVTDEAPPDWTALAEASAHATLFQHPRWTRALARAYPELRPRFLSVTSERELLGVLPFMVKRRLGLTQAMSLPFGTHGGPLLAAEAPTETASLLGEGFAKATASPRMVRAELTLYNPAEALRLALLPSLGHTFQNFQTHVIPLSGDFEELWSRRYRKNTRNCVRMAERAGVTVARERGPDAVRVLAELHAHQAAQFPGIIPHPHHALAAVVEELGDDAHLYVARQAGEALCAILLLDDARDTHAWVSGALENARPVRAYHLMINEGLRDANARGLRAFHFGGSGGQDKLEFFKASFGAEPVPVLRSFKVAGWFRRLRRGPVWD